jgi:hypothetical protein
LQIQIYAQKVVKEVVTKKWVSAPAEVYVEENLNPNAIIPIELTILDQYLVMFQMLKAEIEAFVTSAGQAAIEAAESQAAALLSAQNASESEINAETSENHVATSKQHSGVSEQNALESEQNALDSEIAAKTSEEAAKAVAIRLPRRDA